MDYDVVMVINTIILCSNLNSLPRSGGLFDQDSVWVLLYQEYLVAKSIRDELDQVKAERKEIGGRRSG